MRESELKIKPSLRFEKIMPQYTISPGECVASIAEASGMTLNKIWLDSLNSDLRKLRENPHVLMAGDKIEVPDVAQKVVAAPFDQRHRFRVLGRPVSLRLRILRFEETVKNAKYELLCGDEKKEGHTDEDGCLKVTIIATEMTAYLKIEVDGGEDEFELELGDLAPASELVGIQARLANLGYDPGEIDGELGQLTQQALEIFQEDYDLEVSREADKATREKLEELHGV